MRNDQGASGVPRHIQILYGVGVSYAIVDQIFAQWVLYYYLPPAASTLRPLLPPVLIAVALMVSRLVDMVADPLFGYLSDRTRSRWGRRIPFLAVGAVPLALATVAFFFPPVAANSAIPTFLYLMVVGSLFFLFYTIVGAPYNALIPEISRTRRDRLNLSTWQSVFRLAYTALAMILPGVLIAVLGRGDDELGLRTTMTLMAGLAAAGILVTVFSVDERKYSGGKESSESFFGTLDRVRRNRSLIFYLLGFLFFFLGFNTLRASMNYYVQDIMGYGTASITLASGLLFGCAALSFYPVNRLAKRVGYKKPLLGFLAMLIVLSLALTTLGRILPPWSGFAIFLVFGIPIAGTGFIFPPAMLSEISAAESRREGVQIEGFFFGLQGFFLKLAFFFSIAVTPLLLVQSGEVGLLQGLAEMPEDVTPFGIYSTSYLAAASFLLSLLFYTGYREELSEDEE